VAEVVHREGSNDSSSIDIEAIGALARSFDTDPPPRFNGEWLGFEAEMHHFAIDRHDGGVNSSFADGSVRHLRVRDLWRQKWHRQFNTDTTAAWRWPLWMR